MRTRENGETMHDTALTALELVCKRKGAKKKGRWKDENLGCSICKQKGGEKSAMQKASTVEMTGLCCVVLCCFRVHGKAARGAHQNLRC